MKVHPIFDSREQLSFPVCQRWEGGETFWRPAGEPFRRGDAEVATLDNAERGETLAAKKFIVENHYSAQMPPAQRRFGLYRKDGKLVGVAVFGVPQNDATFDCLGAPARECVEFSRLVLLPEVPGPAETCFIGEAFRALKREGIAGVVSFADPNRRLDEHGNVVLPGHEGGIYQGTNATYLGKSKPSTYWLLPDGTSFPRRTLSKIRNGEQGAEGGVLRLQAAGAGPLDRSPAEWLAYWLPRVARRFHHTGNHKYAWGFWPGVQGFLPPANPKEYPKPQGGPAAPKWGRRAGAAVRGEIRAD